jgi:transcriptional regulator MraZ
MGVTFMPRFRGITAVNLDAKGRFAIPTRYRDTVQTDCPGPLVCTIDTENPCLLLYPLREWEQIESKLQGLSSFNTQTRRIQRLLIGHATEIEIDNHGRLLLPSILRGHAELGKVVMLVGQGNKFELWDEQRWQSSVQQWLVKDGEPEALPEELQTISL